MWELSAARNSYESALLKNISDGRRANEQLVRAVAEQTIHQKSAISSVVVSQDRMAQGISALSVTMSNLSATVGAMLSEVSSQIADLAYQQRLTNTALQQILETLQAPLDTRAKELRKRAEEAYRNGWISDARTDFLESEQLNRYDFTVHHALGTIAFLHTHDLQTARAQFALAAQYARPKSALDTAYALVAGASVEEQLGDLRGAYALADDAVNVGRDTCPEAYYARGRYGLATGGDRDSACSDLETAFWGNPALAVMSMSDTILVRHAAARDAALEEFRAGLADHTAVSVDVLKELRDRLAMVGFEAAPAVYAPVVKDLDAALGEIKKLRSRDSIADHLDALRKASKAERDAYESAKAEAERTVSRLRVQVQQLTREQADLVANTTKRVPGCFALVVLGLVVGFVTAMLFGAVFGASGSMLLAYGLYGLPPGLVIWPFILDWLFRSAANARARTLERRHDPRIAALEHTAVAVRESMPTPPAPGSQPLVRGARTSVAPKPAPAAQTSGPRLVHKPAPAPKVAPAPQPATPPKSIPAAAPAPSAPKAPSTLSTAQAKAIVALADTDHSAAIKLYRELTGASLGEANRGLMQIRSDFRWSERRHRFK